MPGYSNVELANQALDHIGKANIASLTENSVAARKINEVFERTMYSALARSHWTFARKFATLSLVTPTAPNDWDERWAHVYDLPNDCCSFIRVVPRLDVPNTEPQAPHQLQGAYIYTNEVDAVGEYVFETTDTLSMPSTFLDAVSFLLARNVAMPLTRKRGYWADMNDAYEIQLGLAVEIDAGQEPTTYPQEAGGYIDARGGSEADVEGAAPDGSIYWT